MLGIGTIRGPVQRKDPWSKLPQYEWGIRSYEGVQAVIGLLWPWLDVATRVEARWTLERYRSLTSLLEQPRDAVT